MTKSTSIGVLNIHKPEGLTSRRVVDAVCQVMGTSKVGHAGTLDPMATGVLVVCIGAATRLVPYVQEQRKEYRAEFVLGLRSDTDDVTGQVAAAAVTSPPARAQIEALLPRFIGRIIQVPPDFSAIHVNGKRAHERIRRGEQVALQARDVEVHRVELMNYSFPRLDLEIECGSGTYVRSIGRDLGELLGCGAVMSALIRTRIGTFRIADAVPLADLTARSLNRCLLPPLAAVSHLPRQACTPSDLRELSFGRPVIWSQHRPPASPSVALTGLDGELVALGRYSPTNGALFPEHVLVKQQLAMH